MAVDGTTPLTGDWDLGEDRRLQAEALRARDAEGLRLEDAGGNLGLIVEDGGMVGVGVADPTQPLHVASTMSSGGILLDGTTAPAYVLATAAAARLYLAAATAAGNWFTGTAVGDAAVRAQTGDLWIGTQVAAKALRFLTGAGAQRMHLDGSGNVGVGTTDPDGFEVDVAVTEVLQGRNNARLGIRLGSPRLILEEATSGVQWQVDNNAGVFRYFTPGNVALALTTTGRIGSGAAVGTTPQGKLHLHDGTGGLLFVTATGLNSTTATVLIPNATGDVVRGWAGLLVATDGTNSTATTVTLLNPETLDVTVGTVTLRLELLSSGQLQIKRQTGTGTGAVALFGIWL